MSSVGTPDPTPEEPNSAWLTDQELADVRRRIPILYVEAVPVRVDGMGVVTSVGMLLRGNAQGAITRTLVSGRVMFGETLRDALFRHLEKDLGPMAFPLLPPQPGAVPGGRVLPVPGAERVPRRAAARGVARVRGARDRHREPRQDALELTWMTPAEASSPSIHAEMEGGRGTLLRAALASVGVLG